jgi:hypothetical protein
VRRGLAIGSLLLLLAVSCANQTPAQHLSAGLHDQVAAIRAAAERGDADRALTLLQRLADAVESRVADGSLTEEASAEILLAAEGVVSALPLIQPAPPLSPSPTPEVDADDKGKGHGNGEHGKGHGEDEEGD